MRSIVVIDPAQGFPVSLVEAKAHLRVDSDDDDGLIQDVIAATAAHIDGPAGWLGRSLLLQTLELRLDCFDRCEIHLPCGPVSSIVSVTYADPTGTPQILDASNYRLCDDDVVLAFGKSWPTIRSDRDSVVIRYAAGYGTAQDIPRPIKQAMLLHIGHLFANREALSAGNLVELPCGYDALLTPYRLY